MKPTVEDCKDIAKLMDEYSVPLPRLVSFTNDKGEQEVWEMDGNGVLTKYMGNNLVNLIGNHHGINP